MRELEIKVALNDDQWQQLLASPALTNTQSRQLLSTYFDTEDHVLRKNAMSLRVRRSGRQSVQTLKAGIGVADGVSNPIEVESPIAAVRPDLAAVQGALGEELRSLIGEEPLRALFEVDIRRATRLLPAPDGGTVEVAFDEGVIRAGAATETLREVELELKSGGASSLLAVAEQLFGTIGFSLGTESKAERGYRLLTGARPARPEPEKNALAMPYEGQSTADAFAAVCRSVTRQILHNWQVVELSGDPEGPHQLRVGLRRLRTALRAFRPAIDGEELRHLQQEVRELARLVGDVRDLDVLAAEIVGPLALRDNQRQPVRRLLEVLRRQAGRRRGRLQRELKAARWGRLRLRLALLPHGAGWQASATGEAAALRIEEQATIALRKAWKRVKRPARRLDELSIDERHALRKRLKTLRYAAEFFAPAFPAANGAPLLKRIRRLLATFGYLNDVAMAEMLLELSRTEAARNAGRVMAAGYVVGWHSARAEKAWETAQARWQALKSSSRFWE